MKADILIVDDEKDIRFLIREILEDEGYAVQEAAHSDAAIAAMAKTDFALVILDIWLENSELDGMALLKRIKRDKPQTQVLMVSGHGTVEMAVKAIQLGAYDFLEKPFGSERLLLQVQRALDALKLSHENQSLRRETGMEKMWVGHSADAQAVAKQISKLAQSDSRTLIVGETGAGKSLVARMLAGSAPIRPVSHEELLNFLPTSGVIFIDALEQLNKDGQASLLKQLRSSAPIGRIISAAAPTLDTVVAANAFDRELYDRLAINRIDVPPLRNRREDLQDICAQLFPDTPLSDEALVRLKAYAWPHNVRELRQVLELAQTRARIAKDSGIQASHLSLGTQTTLSADVGFGLPLEMDLREAREAFERAYLQAQMLRHDDNVTAVAKAVGMDRAALHRKLKSLQDATPNDEEAA